jgi:hypothetical protein
MWPVLQVTIIGGPGNEWSLTNTGGAIHQDSVLGESKESAWSQVKLSINIKTLGPTLSVGPTFLLLN